MSCKHFPTAILPSILLAASAAAQVAANATVNLGVITIQAGTLPSATYTIPPGSGVPSPLSRVVNSASGIAVASVSNALTSTASAVTLSMTGILACSGSSSGSLAHELLLNVIPVRAVPVSLELEWRVLAPPGVALPIVEVDFDNDGTVDLRGQPNLTVRSRFQLTAARQFLLRSNANLASTVAGWNMRSDVELRIVPDYQDVVVFPILSACSGSVLDVEQTFVRGVSIGSSGLASVHPSLGPTFLVIGFAPQLIPMPGTPLCFLLPSTDIVVPFPSTPLLLDAATVGPLQFFVQGVWLGISPTPMTTTNGEFVRF